MTGEAKKRTDAKEVKTSLFSDELDVSFMINGQEREVRYFGGVWSRKEGDEQQTVF